MIDPRISMMGVVPTVEQPSVALNTFQNMLSQSQNRRVSEGQEQRAQDLAPSTLQQNQQAVEMNNLNIANQTGDAKLKGKYQVGQHIKQQLANGDVEGAASFLEQAVLNGRNSGLTDTSEIDSWIQDLRSGRIDNVIQDINVTDGLYKQQQGVVASAGQREYQNLLDIAQNPKSTQVEKESAEIALGTRAKSSLSAQERIAMDEELAKKVVAQKELEATATETGKSKTQLKFAPQITRAVKLAEKAATEQGDVFTDLARMTSALPGLKESVAELRDLSQVATSTLGGKSYDFIVKQSGFGGTKGATARDKFVAIVRNQVLPLLKQTFGSAFTEKEGEALMATMGDIDASHESRMGQLDAFITQKERSIRTAQAQADQPAPIELGINEFQGFKVIR